MEAAPCPALTETPAETVLSEDHARLCAAFREAVAQEKAQAVRAEAAELASERARQEAERVQADLDAVLRSPSWRAGRALTALPRRVRDRTRS